MNCKCGHTTDEHLRHSEMCYRCRCPEFEDVRLSTLQAQLAEKDARITQLLEAADAMQPFMSVEHYIMIPPEQWARFNEALKTYRR